MAVRGFSYVCGLLLAVLLASETRAEWFIYTLDHRSAAPSHAVSSSCRVFLFHGFVACRTDRPVDSGEAQRVSGSYTFGRPSNGIAGVTCGAEDLCAEKEGQVLYVYVNHNFKSAKQSREAAALAAMLGSATYVSFEAFGDDLTYLRFGVGRGKVVFVTASPSASR